MDPALLRRPIGLKATGPGGQYTRLDYLRGAGISGGLAVLVFAAGLGAVAIAIEMDASPVLGGIGAVLAFIALVPAVASIVLAGCALFRPARPPAFADPTDEWDEDDL